MSDVTVTSRTKIETSKMVAVEVWADSEHAWIKQGSEAILIAFAAVPAVIAALQAAASEVRDE